MQISSKKRKTPYNLAVVKKNLFLREVENEPDYLSTRSMQSSAPSIPSHFSSSPPPAAFFTPHPLPPPLPLPPPSPSRSPS
uniref:Uncharacterized protein n=1 Tax=Oryza brachyantha TaxID=4533 RepID=J3LKY8_ORYBR